MFINYFLILSHGFNKLESKILNMLFSLLFLLLLLFSSSSIRKLKFSFTGSAICGETLVNLLLKLLSL